MPFACQSEETTRVTSFTPIKHLQGHLMLPYKRRNFQISLIDFVQILINDPNTGVKYYVSRLIGKRQHWKLNFYKI